MAGDHVRVWVDKWIPSLPSGHPTPLEDDETRGSLVVSSIIDHENSAWQLDSITDLLSTEDRETILTTPISDPTKYDRLVWSGDRKSKFSVKSGYRWLHDRNGRSHPPRQSGPDTFEPKLWNYIWSLDVPPKIRNFMWRALRRGLATKLRLLIRRCATSPLCPFCGSSEESLLELLDTNHGSKEERQKALSILAFTYWHIWKVRCTNVFNNKLYSPTQSILALNGAFASFWEARSRVIKASEVCSAEALAILKACDWSWALRSANQTADFVVSHSGAEMCDNV
ncbi:hypothetical protein EV1_024001 [Malus domestica]